MFTTHGTTASIFTQELGEMVNYIIADKSTALATVIYPGNNYYHRTNTDWEFQLRTNPFLQFHYQGEFIKYRLDGK